MFDPRLDHVRFVVKRVALDRVSPSTLGFPLPSLVLLIVPHSLISLSSTVCISGLDTKCVVKQQATDIYLSPQCLDTESLFVKCLYRIEDAEHVVPYSSHTKAVVPNLWYAEVEVKLS
jgi:hypothetical protein